MTLTMTDLFCGAGGSSTGAVQVPGVQVRVASNHWNLAVETHNTNRPDTDHICADISQIDPRYFPPTDLLWASPSCTHHSIAQGKKRISQPDMFEETLPEAAAERSRATMFDVPRFAEHHEYRAVIVENVVEVTKWVLFPAWLTMMDALGYAHRVVSLNAMHAQAQGLPAPQSRDRVYIALWRKGDRAPDLERMQRPRAVCPSHGVVDAMQAWKPGRKIGCYRQQYLYRCPRVECRNTVVEPGWLPATSFINWANRGQRIGDQKRPLVAKTLARIQAGIDRYWVGPQTSVTFSPLIAELRGGGSTSRPASQPLATVTASGNHHALIAPYYGSTAAAQPITDALPTVTTVDRHALIMRNNTGGAEMTTPAAHPARTITTAGHQSLLTGGPTIDIDDVLFRMLEPDEVKQAMAFPKDYVLLGNRREQVRQSGNAVCPPAARDLVSAVAGALS